MCPFYTVGPTGWVLFYLPPHNGRLGDMLGVRAHVCLYAYGGKWCTSTLRSLNHSHQLAKIAKLMENEPFDCSPSHFEILEG